MGRQDDTVALFLIAISIIADAWYLTNADFSGALGLDPSIGADLATIFPGLLITIIGLVSATRGGPLAVGGFSAAGIGLAVLFGEMYVAGIIDDTLLGGASLIQLQTLTIIVAALMGGVAYSVSRHN
jgi:hypothetical protein